MPRTYTVAFKPTVETLKSLHLGTKCNVCVHLRCHQEGEGEEQRAAAVSLSSNPSIL